MCGTAKCKITDNQILYEEETLIISASAQIVICFDKTMQRYMFISTKNSCKIIPITLEQLIAYLQGAITVKDILESVQYIFIYKEAIDCCIKVAIEDFNYTSINAEYYTSKVNNAVVLNYLRSLQQENDLLDSSYK
jgi:hypothetical protein